MARTPASCPSAEMPPACLGAPRFLLRAGAHSAAGEAGQPSPARCSCGLGSGPGEPCNAGTALLHSWLVKNSAEHLGPTLPLRPRSPFPVTQWARPSPSCPSGGPASLLCSLLRWARLPQPPHPSSKLTLLPEAALVPVTQSLWDLAPGSLPWEALSWHLCW